MSKTFRPYDPDQQLLLPAALQEWLPSDHLASPHSHVPAGRSVPADLAQGLGEKRCPGSPVPISDRGGASWTPAFARAGFVGHHQAVIKVKSGAGLPTIPG